MWGLFPWLPKNLLQKRLENHMQYIFLCDWLLMRENPATVPEKDIAKVMCIVTVCAIIKCLLFSVLCGTMP